MKYAYRAFDRSGKAVSDTVEAASLAEAQDHLRKQGLFPTELTERTGGGTGGEGPSVSGSAARSHRSGKGTRLRDVTVFMRQLAVLVSTGTPMVDALDALERQSAPGPWRNALADIRRRVEEGSTLATAMQDHPSYFDAVSLSLISAGESGGKLEEMLKRLALLLRQQMKVRASIMGAMVYPCLLLCVSGGVLATLLFFVLPKFEGLFQSLGAPLPPSTRVLMDFSAELRQYWWAVLGGLIAGGFGLRSWLASPAGSAVFHRLLVRAPQIGKVARALATARIARVLGVLVEGRVPLLDALQLTRQASGNLCYAELIGRAEDMVTRGESVSTAFQESPLVPRSITEAIRSGERSGQLGKVLVDLADFLDEDNEVLLRSLSSIIEPLILIVLGVVIGFVAISMFLPLFDLATAARGGGGS